MRGMTRGICIGIRTRVIFWSDAESNLRASVRSNIDPTYSNFDLGFRVASVPEPSCAMLILSAGLLTLARRRRRAARPQGTSGP